MRDKFSWRRAITKNLKKNWPEDVHSPSPEHMVEVELGLHLLSHVAPGERATALWVALTGYPHLLGDIEPDPELSQILGTGRHILLPFKNHRTWASALEAYRGLPDWLRGFDVDPTSGEFSRRDVSYVSDRFDVYDEVLRQPLPYQRKPVHQAPPGTYVVSAGRSKSSVVIPKDLVPDKRVPSHDLSRLKSKKPISVCWRELLDTAQYMDDLEAAAGKQPHGWRAIMDRVRLDLMNGSGAFEQASTLTLDGMLHLVGMVSSGKSTLMDVFTIWAARNGLHVTIVVGDVIEALRRVNRYNSLGVEAAPILGASNRKRHIERLHLNLSTNAELPPLMQSDPAFDWLSTACLLDGLRDSPHPFASGHYPCQSLETPDGEDGEEETKERRVYSCPLYGVCQQDKAAIGLVSAKVWVATPASLAYTSVPPEISPERIRYAELVYRKSDLLIIDEADLVQVQMDSIFSPSQTLIGSAEESWLDDLADQATRELRRGGRGQFGETGVSSWVSALDSSRTATNRLYALLRQEKELRRWVSRDYFTNWVLAERLSRDWSGSKDEGNADYLALREEFSKYIADPLGDQGRDTSTLCQLTRQALPATSEEVLRDELRTWLTEHPNVHVDENKIENEVLKLEFTLLLSALQDRLDMLISEWRKVEGPLNLEGASPLLFHKPPEDFTPVTPEAPMGNALGFQYLHPTDSSEQMGELRFFRASGVGRWMVTDFHRLFRFDGIRGPNTLLLSGTSWAGTSPSYHVQVPVGGVLRAPDEEVAAIEKSVFAFRAVRNNQGEAITISGRRGGERSGALRDMLTQLARRGRMASMPSVLETQLSKLPENRRRILLLVGSYEEARIAHACLIQVREDWRGRILHLVPDDEDFESTWGGEAHLRRGEVAHLARTGADILIAPLLAIERGHNVLNDDNVAAIGAAYFLVRPHPRPDDINYAIHSVNRWAMDRATYGHIAVGSLEDRGRDFRDTAYHRWRALLRLPMIYGTLPDRERDALTWSALVGIWQVIGRLVRGGQPAIVHFCDAAFAKRAASSETVVDDASSSLLTGMRQVLSPYFDDSPLNPVSETDRELVKVLYGPFYRGLTHLQVRS